MLVLGLRYWLILNFGLKLFTTETVGINKLKIRLSFISPTFQSDYRLMEGRCRLNMHISKHLLSVLYAACKFLTENSPFGCSTSAPSSAPHLQRLRNPTTSHTPPHGLPRSICRIGSRILSCASPNFLRSRPVFPYITLRTGPWGRCRVAVKRHRYIPMSQRQLAV